MALSELMTLIILAACFNAIHFTTADEGLFYTAAVYEHKVLLNTQPNVAVGRQAALQHMYRNLEVFEQQVTSAAQQVMYRVCAAVGGKAQALIFTMSS